jgi:hypothetical protein
MDRQEHSRFTNRTYTPRASETYKKRAPQLCREAPRPMQESFSRSMSIVVVVPRRQTQRMCRTTSTLRTLRDQTDDWSSWWIPFLDFSDWGVGPGSEPDFNRFEYDPNRAYPDPRTSTPSVSAHALWPRWAIWIFAPSDARVVFSSRLRRPGRHRRYRRLSHRVGAMGHNRHQLRRRRRRRRHHRPAGTAWELGELPFGQLERRKERKEKRRV